MSTLTPRQPFGVLNESRLQALTSIKNRQNNIFAAHMLPLKPTPSSAPTKRPLSSTLLADEDFDSENIDPVLSSKRVKGSDGTPKVSKFSLQVTPKSAPFTFSSTRSLPTATPTIASTPTVQTPSISQSRGTLPKSTSRIGSAKRRFVHPNSKGSSIPFSIDAALSGTVSNYTPSSLSKVTNISSPSPPHKLASKKPQPASWFFDIHEDTPDQEASNLLNHHAAVLDISSDDDGDTVRAKDAAQRGKENVPPPEYVSSRSAANVRARDQPVAPEAMVEDRRALGELDVKLFWKEGKEEEVVVVNDEREEEVEENMRVPHNTPVKGLAREEIVVAAMDGEFAIFADNTATAVDSAYL